MEIEQQRQPIPVSPRMYDDLKRAAMEEGLIPQQRLESESFAAYVRRYPQAPK